MGYDSDETNARSISSLSNRSSPLSWRHGQSSPRLQAGDAPSSTGGYQGSKVGSQYTAHTMPTRCSSHLSSTSRIELIEGLDADDLKSGYLSDSDLLGKSLPDDDDDNLANGYEHLKICFHVVFLMAGERLQTTACWFVLKRSARGCRCCHFRLSKSRSLVNLHFKI